jgi:hypothetical protein
VVATHGVHGHPGWNGVAGHSEKGASDRLDLFDSDDLLALVVAATGADPMGKLRLVAVGTEAQARSLEVVVRPALVAAGLGMTALGIRHR